MLGHELRNPLAPMLTALQLMRLRGGAELERERQVLERQTRHLVRLVDDLMDVSRITRGKVELRRQLVEIASVVARAIEIASPLIEQRAQHLEVAVPPQGMLVDADPARLAQVLANLLTNAAKYTPSGGRVEVSATRQGSQIELRVRDDGIGIAPELLPRIFDLFVQGERSSDRSSGGLGLGLAIVKSLVQLHAGQVSAQSEGLGRGTTFVVLLPAAAARRLALVPEEAAPQRTDAPSLRVLVVDDNVDAADMLGEILRELGHEVRVAHDGPAALVAASDFEPHLALLDIGLPVMDGYELAERLRDLPGRAGLRLIALTGFGQESDRARALEAGFHEHFVKPVDIDQLASALRPVRRRRHARRVS